MRRNSLACLLLLVATSANADILAVNSYDTPNGYGQASGGSFNYWDGTYTGSGDKTQDGAPLSGGVGALTDGVVTNQPWYDVSNVQGTGPYVGWRFIDPTITFHLAGVTSYSEIDVHVDNSDAGGVSAPSSIDVSDGTHSQTYAVAIPPPGGPIWIDLDVSGLGLAGDTVSVTLHRSNTWVFSDEIRFQGTAAVPEPAGLALLGIGLAGSVGVARRAWRKGLRRG